MRKSILLFALLLTSAFAFGTTVALSGTATDGATPGVGNAIASGTLVFKLMNCGFAATQISTGFAAPTSTSITLNASGVLASTLAGDDDISCGATSYYTVSAFRLNGTLVWKRNYSITGATWNVGTAPILAVLPAAPVLLMNPMTALGDVVIGGAGGIPVRLPLGATNNCIQSNGTTLIYGACGGGGSGAANLVLATPDGASGSSTLRALVANDLPALAEAKITNLTTDLAAKEVAANKNVASGYAGLDAGIKLLASQIPNPSATTLGGTESKDCTGSGHIVSISTLGVPTCSADTGSGTGTVTNTLGALTLGKLMIGNGLNDSKIDANVSDDGSGNLTTSGIVTAVKFASSTSVLIQGPAGTCAVSGASIGVVCISTTGNVPTWSFNGGATSNFKLASDVGSAAGTSGLAMIGDIQALAYTFAAGGGVSNAYTVTLAPAPTLVAGSIVRFKIAADNTAASTIAVNGGAAVTLKKSSSAGLTDLAAGDLKANMIVSCVYDGTFCQMQVPVASASGVVPGSPNASVQFNSSGAFAGSANFTYAPTSGISLIQGGNGATVSMIYGTRNTNVSPLGNFVRFQDAGAATDLFVVDINGKVTTGSDLVVGASAGSSGIFMGSGGILKFSSRSSIQSDSDGAITFVATAGAFNELRFQNGAGGPHLYIGASDPNGSKIGTLGSIFLNTAGGIANSFYIKEANDNTNTGWVGVGTQISKIYVEAAGCNGSSASPSWDLPVSAAPTANCNTGTNIQEGTLQFADAQSAQFKLPLPLDWTGAVDAKIFFADSSTTGTVIFNIATACSVVDGSATDDVAFNAANAFGTVTLGATASGQWVGTVAGLTTTGCSAGQVLQLKVSRATDTAAGTANVKGVQLTIRRSNV